jgi:hypothetical protein
MLRQSRSWCLEPEVLLTGLLTFSCLLSGVSVSVSPSLTSQEEDGSLLIEKILGRRPRKTGRKWYIRPEGEYVTSVEQCCFACLSAVSYDR